MYINQSQIIVMQMNKSSKFSVGVGNLNAMEKGKFIYVYDALCGWCYGFSPVISKIYEEHKSSLEFEVISGGMILGDRIGPIGEVAPYIKNAYKQVEERADVKFGAGFLKGILEDGKAVFTSIPPANALSAFKEFLPERAVEFAHTLQNAIYSDGIEIENKSVYPLLAEKYGIDSEEFATKMNGEEVAEKARLDFAFSSQLQVSGFPTVFYTKNSSEFFVIAQGYTDYETLAERLQKVIGN
ncbi:MAG: putative protein-disulfide isomerase [Flammeovirgaceae bacterium]|jgi:putative protein-disulfide isomerase